MKKKFVYSLALISLFLIQANVNASGLNMTESASSPKAQINIDNIMNYLDKDSIVPLNAENTEFTYKLNGKTGYLNKTEHFGFITEYENIVPLNNYLKVKKNGKYGLIDKTANVILQPKYQDINIKNSDGIEYIEAKVNGRYKMYYNTGKLMTLNEAYEITHDTSLLLANDIKPEIMDFIVENLKAQSPQITANVNKNVDTAVNPYEISELPVPGRVKVAHVEKEVPSNVQPVEEEPQKVVEVPEVQISNKTEKKETESDYFTVNNKKYFPFTEENKLGIMDENKFVIIPAKYNGYKVVTHDPYSNPVIVMSRNKAYTIFDIKGKLLAEQVYDKINVYDGRAVYNFRIADNKGYIQKNGKDIGTLVKTNGEYVYTKSCFSLKPTFPIKMITTILDINK